MRSGVAWSSQPLGIAAVDAIFAAQGDSPTHRRIFHDAYGADYPEEAEPLSYLAVPELRRVARELAVGAGQTIADFGCGRGGPGLWVALETGASLVGIDLSERGIEQARKRSEAFLPAGRARFEVGNLAALPLDSEAFAGGMSIAVI